VICDFGDVVVVPFPFVDRPIAKRRPAVVLSNRDFNTAHDQSLFAMITTGGGSTWPSDIGFDWTQAGLQHACILRWKVFTLPQLLILRRIGRLAPGDVVNVGTALRANTGPDPA